MIVSVTRISKTLGGKKFYHFPIIKITSLLTILSFVLPYVGFAFTPANYPADPVGAYGYTNILGNGKKITIPNDFGDITSSFQGQQPLTVVCVQDLHCNFEVQQNMAGIIRNLAKKNKLKLIAVEGENQAIDVSQLSTIPVSSVRDQVGNYFLKRGMITGAEFQAALSDQPLLLHGIEEKAIYDQSKQLLNQFFNAETQGHCEDLRFALDDLKPAIYNESLAKIDHEHMAYEYNKISFNKFSTFLIRAAKEAQLDLTPYAALMDAIQNAKVANSKLYVQDHLIAQAEQLEKAVRQVHYTTNYQRNLDHYIEILDIIESMVNISATPAQLARFFKERQTFSVTNILEFIETASLELGETTFIVDDAMSLDQSMLIVEQFYQLVDKRSLVFVKKLMALMKAKQESLAVMVTGGFHTPIIEELLKKQGVSFITVKPRLTNIDVTNPYFSLLRDQKSSLEMLLAKKEVFFSLWSRFGTQLFRDHLEFIKEATKHYEAHLSGKYKSAEAKEQFLQEFGQRDQAQQLNFEFSETPFYINENETSLAVKISVDNQVYIAVITNTDKFKASQVKEKVLEESLSPQVGLRLFAPEQIGVVVVGDKLQITNQELFDLMVKQEIRPGILDLAKTLITTVSEKIQQFDFTAGWARAQAIVIQIRNNIPEWINLQTTWIVSGVFFIGTLFLLGSATGIVSALLPVTLAALFIISSVLITQNMQATPLVRGIAGMILAITATIFVFNLSGPAPEIAMHSPGMTTDLTELTASLVASMVGLIGMTRKLSLGSDPLPPPYSALPHLDIALENLSLRFKESDEKRILEKGKNKLAQLYDGKGITKEKVKINDIIIKTINADDDDNLDAGQLIKLRREGILVRIFPQTNEAVIHVLNSEPNKENLILAAGLALLSNRSLKTINQLLLDAQENMPKNFNPEDESSLIDRLISHASKLGKSPKFLKQRRSMNFEFKLIIKAILGLDKQLVVEKFSDVMFDIITQSSNENDELEYYINTLIFQAENPRMNTVAADILIRLLDKLITTIKQPLSSRYELLNKIKYNLDKINRKGLKKVLSKLQPLFLEAFEHEKVYIPEDLQKTEYAPYLDKQPVNGLYSFAHNFKKLINTERDKNLKQELLDLYADLHFERTMITEIYQSLFKNKEKTSLLQIFDAFFDQIDQLKSDDINRRLPLLKLLVNNIKDEEAYIGEYKRAFALVTESLSQGSTTVRLEVLELLNRLTKMPNLYKKIIIPGDVNNSTLIGNTLMEIGLDASNRIVTFISQLRGRELAKRYKNLENEMAGINLRIKILSNIASITMDNNIINYLGDIAKIDTWHKNIRAITQRALFPLIPLVKMTRNSIIHIFINHLEPGLADHNIAGLKLLLNKRINPNKFVLALGQPIYKNPRTAYFLIKRHQDDKDLLEQIIKAKPAIPNQEPSMAARLYAFHLYVHYHLSGDSQKDFEKYQELRDVLIDSKNENNVFNYIEQVRQGNESMVNLLSDFWLQDEEAKVLYTAVWLDNQLKDDADETVERKNFKTITLKISEAMIAPYYTNFDSNLNIGGQLIAKAEYSTDSVLAIFAHELGHLELKFGIDYLSGPLKASIVHEYYADKRAQAFAVRHDSDIQGYKQLLKFETMQETVRKYGHTTVQAHEGARGQDRDIDDEIGQENRNPDQESRAIIEVLKESDLRKKSLKDLFKLFLTQFISPKLLSEIAEDMPVDKYKKGPMALLDPTGIGNLLDRLGFVGALSIAIVAIVSASLLFVAAPDQIVLDELSKFAMTSAVENQPQWLTGMAIGLAGTLRYKGSINLEKSRAVFEYQLMAAVDRFLRPGFFTRLRTRSAPVDVLVENAFIDWDREKMDEFIDHLGYQPQKPELAEAMILTGLELAHPQISDTQVKKQLQHAINLLASKTSAHHITIKQKNRQITIKRINVVQLQPKTDDLPPSYQSQNIKSFAHLNGEHLTIYLMPRQSKIREGTTWFLNLVYPSAKRSWTWQLSLEEVQFDRSDQQPNAFQVKEIIDILSQAQQDLEEVQNATLQQQEETERVVKQKLIALYEFSPNLVFEQLRKMINRLANKSRYTRYFFQRYLFNNPRPEILVPLIRTRVDELLQKTEPLNELDYKRLNEIERYMATVKNKIPHDIQNRDWNQLSESLVLAAESYLAGNNQPAFLPLVYQFVQHDPLGYISFRLLGTIKKTYRDEITRQIDLLDALASGVHQIEILNSATKISVTAQLGSLLSDLPQARLSMNLQREYRNKILTAMANISRINDSIRASQWQSIITTETGWVRYPETITKFTEFLDLVNAKTSWSGLHRAVAGEEHALVRGYLDKRSDENREQLVAELEARLMQERQAFIQSIRILGNLLAHQSEYERRNNPFVPMISHCLTNPEKPYANLVLNEASRFINYPEVYQLFCNSKVPGVTDPTVTDGPPKIVELFKSVDERIGIGKKSKSELYLRGEEGHYDHDIARLLLKRNAKNVGLLEKVIADSESLKNSSKSNWINYYELRLLAMNYYIAEKVEQIKSHPEKTIFQLELLKTKLQQLIRHEDEEDLKEYLDYLLQQTNGKKVAEVYAGKQQQGDLQAQVYGTALIVYWLDFLNRHHAKSITPKLLDTLTQKIQSIHIEPYSQEIEDLRIGGKLITSAPLPAARLLQLFSYDFGLTFPQAYGIQNRWYRKTGIFMEFIGQLFFRIFSRKNNLSMPDEVNIIKQQQTMVGPNGKATAVPQDYTDQAFGQREMLSEILATGIKSAADLLDDQSRFKLSESQLLIATMRVLHHPRMWLRSTDDILKRILRVGWKLNPQDYDILKGLRQLEPGQEIVSSETTGNPADVFINNWLASKLVSPSARLERLKVFLGEPIFNAPIWETVLFSPIIIGLYLGAAWPTMIGLIGANAIFFGLVHFGRSPSEKVELMGWGAVFGSTLAAPVFILGTFTPFAVVLGVGLSIVLHSAVNYYKFKSDLEATKHPIINIIGILRQVSNTLFGNTRPFMQSIPAIIALATLAMVTIAMFMPGPAVAASTEIVQQLTSSSTAINSEATVTAVMKSAQDIPGVEVLLASVVGVIGMVRGTGNDQTSEPWNDEHLPLEFSEYILENKNLFITGPVLVQGRNAHTYQAINNDNGKEFIIKISDKNEQLWNKAYENGYLKKLKDNPHSVIILAEDLGTYSGSGYSLDFQIIPRFSSESISFLKWQSAFFASKGESNKGDFPWIFEQLFSAVAFMHLRGVSHKDLDPAFRNVWIDKMKQQIYIIDPLIESDSDELDLKTDNDIISLTMSMLSPNFKFSNNTDQLIKEIIQLMNEQQVENEDQYKYLVEKIKSASQEIENDLTAEKIIAKDKITGATKILLSIIFVASTAIFLSAIFYPGPAIAATAEITQQLATSGAVINSEAAVAAVAESNPILETILGIVAVGIVKKPKTYPRSFKDQVISHVNSFYAGKVPQYRTAIKKFIKEFTSSGQPIHSIGEIDSYTAYETIYGQIAARFLYEVTIHELQLKCKKNRAYIYRQETSEGRFGVSFKGIEADKAKGILQQLQLEVHNALRRRIQVMTLGEEDDFSQAHIDGINSILKTNKLLGIAFLHNNRIHIALDKPEAEKDVEGFTNLENYLRTIGLLEDKKSLFERPFDVSNITGFNSNYFPDPKLTVAMARDLPRTEEKKEETETKGKKQQWKSALDIKDDHRNKISGMEERAVSILNKHNLTNGGEIILLPVEEEQVIRDHGNEVVTYDLDYFASERNAALYLHQRYVSLFESWFLETAQRLFEQKRISSFMDLYNNNILLIQESSIAFIDTIHYHATELVKAIDTLPNVDQGDKALADDFLLRITNTLESKRSEGYADKLRELLGDAYDDVMGHLKQLIVPDDRQDEIGPLQQVVDDTLKSLSIATEVAKPRVKKIEAIVGNFNLNWSKFFTSKPDLKNIGTYTEKSVLKITDDIIGSMIYINNEDDMITVAGDLIRALENSGYVIDYSESGAFKADYKKVDGQWSLVRRGDYYYDYKIKLAPNDKLKFGGEIKLVEKTLDKGTRPGYRIRKEKMLNDQNWLVTVIGTRNRMRRAAAMKMASKFEYSYVRLTQIKQAVAYVIKTNPDIANSKSKINKLIYQLSLSPDLIKIDENGKEVKAEALNKMNDKEVKKLTNTQKILFDGQVIPDEALKVITLTEIKELVDQQVDSKVMIKLLGKMFASKRKVVLEANSADVGILDKISDYTLEAQATTGSIAHIQGKYQRSKKWKFQYAKKTAGQGGYTSQAITGLVRRMEEFLGDQVAGTQKTTKERPAFGEPTTTGLAVLAIGVGTLLTAIGFMSYAPTTLASTGVTIANLGGVSEFLAFFQTMNLPELAIMILVATSGLALIRWGRGQLRIQPAKAIGDPINQMKSATNAQTVIDAIKSLQAIGVTPVTDQTDRSWLAKIRLNWRTSRLGSYIMHQRDQLIRVLTIGPSGLQYRWRMGIGTMSPLLQGLLSSTWMKNIDLAKLEQTGELNTFIEDYFSIIEAIDNQQEREQGIQLLSMLTSNIKAVKQTRSVHNIGLLTLPRIFNSWRMKQRLNKILNNTQEDDRNRQWLLRGLGGSA